MNSSIALRVVYSHHEGDLLVGGVVIAAIAAIDGNSITGADAMSAGTLWAAPPGTKLTLGLTAGHDHHDRARRT